MIWTRGSFRTFTREVDISQKQDGIRSNFRSQVDVDSIYRFLWFYLRQVDLYNSSEKSRCAISGIFIKNVIADSPAGKSGDLKVEIEFTRIGAGVKALKL